jgi:STE24 endopeptidase
MRRLILAGLLLFLVLFSATIVFPAAAARAEAERYFSPDVIERGLQRSRQGKLLFLTATLVQTGTLALVALTGFGRRLTDELDRWTGGRWLLTLLLLGFLLFLGDQVLSLPFSIAALEWQRSWGLTHRSLGDWLIDYGKMLGLSAAGSAVVLILFYALVRFFPRAWWWLGAVGGTGLAVVLALVLPIWISPLFNTFTPLGETPWADLQQPVRELARRVGVPVQDVLVMDASRQGGHTNAYFTGFAGTRRVVLFDTLLKSHTRLSPEAIAGTVALPASGLGSGPALAVGPPLARITLGEQEVLSVVAHEFGHWEHHHIVKGLILGFFGGLVGLFVLSRLLNRAVSRAPWHLKTPADPAGLPLLLLLLIVGNWCTLPVANAISRHFERQADQASLELADHPQVFIEAEKRLAIDNISNVAPNRLSVWLLATHPPAVERIQMAERWKEIHHRVTENTEKRQN